MSSPKCECVDMCVFRMTSSSSSKHSDSTDPLDSFLPSAPICLCFWQVFEVASSVFTDLRKINFC